MFEFFYLLSININKFAIKKKTKTEQKNKIQPWLKDVKKSRNF